MRGWKAKGLRKLALALHPETEDDVGYFHPGAPKVKKFGRNADGGFYEYLVTGQLVVRSQAHRLYKHMKKDLAKGGT